MLKSTTSQQPVLPHTDTLLGFKFLCEITYTQNCISNIQNVTCSAFLPIQAEQNTHQHHHHIHLFEFDKHNLNET